MRKCSHGRREETHDSDHLEWGERCNPSCVEAARPDQDAEDREDLHSFRSDGGKHVPQERAKESVSARTSVKCDKKEKSVPNVADILRSFYSCT